MAAPVSVVVRPAIPEVRGMTERRLAAEEARIAEARQAYERHIPSMFTHQCLGCDERWPCLTYREALAVLRTAGQPPDA